MEFMKVHGLGNDFILLEQAAYEGRDLAKLAIRLCDRHTGIGADGLLLVAAPGRKDADICMRIINQDGSEAEMCGNGIRCFARYVFEQGLVSGTEFRVETKAGVMVPHITVEAGRVKAVKIDMGKPALERQAVPMEGPAGQVVSEKLVLEDGSSYAITSMFMGVPHTMVFVDSLCDALVSSVGRRIEKNPVFPQGTNVNFVVLHSRSEIEVRTWERGAGATLACGTGCCASAVAACLNGYTDRDVTVQVQLGSLQIQYAADETVWMSGPAEIVYRGVWDNI